MIGRLRAVVQQHARLLAAMRASSKLDTRPGICPHFVPNVVHAKHAEITSTTSPDLAWGGRVGCSAAWGIDGCTDCGCWV